MNSIQKNVFNTLLSTLNETIDSGINININNHCPPAIDSPLAVDDIAAAIFAVQGGIAATLGKMKGLSAQDISIDRRHAGNTLNSVAWHFQNTYQLDISVVHTDINGFFKTADGKHIIYNGAYPHLRKIILDYLKCPNNHELITQATLKYDAIELETELSARGACIAFVRDQTEWQQHDQGKYLAKVPVIELIKVAESAPIPLPEGNRILSGIKTLDLTKVLAGPQAGKQLAEHGSDVIHIRHPYQDLIYPFDIETSYGKTNCYLDFECAQDRNTLIQLIKQTDVFLEGYRYGALDKHELGIKELLKLNSNIINVRLNAYGFDGPWAHRRGFEQLAQAVTGAAVIQGGSLKSPSLIPAYMNDYLTGYLAALGTMAALMKRAKEGGAWIVNVSLAKTCMFVIEHGHQTHDSAKPTHLSELREWLVDQEGQLGTMTRLEPVIKYSQTPAYSAIAGTAPGSHLPKWEQIKDSFTIPHYRTKVFDHLHVLKNMSLH